MSWHLAFNTAWSFTCNADWQSYSGEGVMSNFSQTVALSVHQFLSGAVGLAVLVAVGRALKRATVKSIGNFWADLTRSLIYIVIPLSVLWAMPLAWQGVPQSWKAYPTAHLVEPYTTQVQKTDDKGNPVNGADGKPVMVDAKVDTQPIPIGPVASFESCKQLFTNGGGWYGVNSAHPLENPTPLSDFLEMLAIIVVPMAQVYMFGLLVGNKRHAWCLFAVMLALYVLSFAVAWYGGVAAQPGHRGHSCPNMEGKEQRFGVMNSVLWGDLLHGDRQRLGQFHARQLDAAGRPDADVEHPGRRNLLRRHRLRHVLHAVPCPDHGVHRRADDRANAGVPGQETGRLGGDLGGDRGAVPNAACLIPTAISCMIPSVISSTLGNNGPHGLSEILYAYGEAANNNGSAFAGLNANVPLYDVALGVAIIIGRFAPIAAALAIVGRLASKKTVEASAGHAADPRLDLRPHPDGRHRDRRRADLFPGALPRAAWSSTA